MKKLIINGLIIAVFVVVIAGVIVGLSKMRAVDEAGAVIDAYDYADAYAVQKEVLDESSVTITVSEEDVTEEDIQEPVEEVDSTNSQISAFLNS